MSKIKSTFAIASLTLVSALASPLPVLAQDQQIECRADQTTVTDCHYDRNGTLLYCKTVCVDIVP